MQQCAQRSCRWRTVPGYSP